MGKKLRIIVPIVVVVLGLAGFGFWYTVLRDDAPEEASIENVFAGADSTAASASESTEADSTASGSGTTAGDTATTDAATSATSAAASGSSLEGTWTVQPGETVFAGYRVEEQFAGETIKKTAAGRTPNVTGTLTIDGTQVIAAEITVDMTTLASDAARRDNYIKDNGLQTNSFPESTFDLSEPIELGSVPTEGQQIQATATGNLTLHGVTKPVQIPITAQLQGGVIGIAGSLPIAMADYNISPPSIGGFVTVDDNGVMEMQLLFSRSA